MSENSDPSVTQGRPVRLVPTPPGFWLTLLGAGAAVIAPLFGFLVGSASGQGEAVLSPLYWGLFTGVVVGGLGVVVAAFGARRLWLHSHREDLVRSEP